MKTEKVNKTRKVTNNKKGLTQKEIEKHPFETDSQIENRYGNGREKNGSDGTTQDNRGSNH